MTDIKPTKGRVLSGMRPTGKLHLGNYVGALRNWVKLQDEYDCFFFIADWHALTTDYADTSAVKQNSLEVILDYLAAGLDPERSTLFIQSHVPQHAELHLLFSMITPLGWLERVPSYKEQRENLKEKDLGTYGFLGYPLLQAADILLYSPPPDLPECDRELFVPVGEDQVPHVEMTREVARRFNYFYPLGKWEAVTSELAEEVRSGIPVRRRPHPKYKAMFAFPEPQPLLTPAAKLPGIDGRKMSKSYNNFISLTEDPDSIREKLSRMVNDPRRARLSEPGNPDDCPVGDLHKLFSGDEVRMRTDSGCRTAGISCIECKSLAADSVIQIVQPIRLRRLNLEKSPDAVWKILDLGAQRARDAAEESMRMVREAMGLSHDLGSMRPSARPALGAQSHVHPDLSYWDAERTERGNYLRQEWLQHLPSTIALQVLEHRVYRTATGKRVAVPTAREQAHAPGEWVFLTRDKTYEILVLLCWRRAPNELIDFVIPQNVLQPIWKKFETDNQKKRNRIVRVFKVNGDFLMRVPGGEPVRINDLQAQYSPLER